MERDELILSCQGFVNNLVKKYNNHKSDEDLQQVGMVGVIKCVDKCLAEGITDVDQIQKKCNISARNEILMEIYKEKLKIADDVEIEEVGEEDSTELMIYLEQVLTPREMETMKLTLNGLSINEIATKMGVIPDMIYRYLRKIKNKILKMDK